MYSSCRLTAMRKRVSSMRKLWATLQYVVFVIVPKIYIEAGVVV